MTVGERQSIKTSRQINFILYQIGVSVLKKKKKSTKKRKCVYWRGGVTVLYMVCNKIKCLIRDNRL